MRIGILLVGLFAIIAILALAPISLGTLLLISIILGIGLGLFL